MLLESNLKTWLQELLEGLISQTNLTMLVHHCRSIAESYLIQHRSSLVHICALNGFNVQDLAFDCIAEVFARDEDGKFYQFENFTNSLFTNFEETSEQELFLAFKSFVLRIVKTQLSKIYTQSDPVGAKIHRNIRDCIRKSHCLKLVEDFRGYVLQPTNHEPLDHLEAFPQDKLERELLARTSFSSNIPDLLEEISVILIEQEEYRRAIRLIDVVQIFKKFYVQFSDMPTMVENPLEFKELSQFDIDVIKRDVRRAVQEKIISTSFLPGKVSKKEAEDISAVLFEIIDDWCRGEGTKTSLYQYLWRYIPISESDYVTIWRTKLEYLIRIAREKFAACITENI